MIERINRTIDAAEQDNWFRAEKQEASKEALRGKIVIDYDWEKADFSSVSHLSSTLASASGSTGLVT